ncbi:MAG: hypothetical protein B6U72_04430 [Candidatus Altiarchaeales archaeon ex4484_2]|nr:MAG: hypothetical protein B6U72_04430 [Candidatus Altiarchaeales archaeon ex4484_2]
MVSFDKGVKSKGNCELILSSGRDHLPAVKNSAELRERITKVDEDMMLELLRYEGGDRVLGWWKKQGRVYEYIYFDERRARKDSEKRARKIKQVLAEKEKLAEKIRQKGVKALKWMTRRKKITKELNNRVITTEVTVQRRLTRKTDEEIIAELEGDQNLDGFFALESSRNLKPKNALRLCRRKD